MSLHGQCIMEGNRVDHTACVLGMSPATILERSFAHCVSNCMPLLQASNVMKEDMVLVARQQDRVLRLSGSQLSVELCKRTMLRS